MCSPCHQDSLISRQAFQGKDASGRKEQEGQLPGCSWSQHSLLFLRQDAAKPGESKCSRQSSLQGIVTLFKSGTAGPADLLSLASDCHHPTPSSSLPFSWSSQGGGSPFWSGLLRKPTRDYPLSVGLTSSHEPNHCLSHHSPVTWWPNANFDKELPPLPLGNKYGVLHAGKCRSL